MDILLIHAATADCKLSREVNFEVRMNGGPWCTEKSGSTLKLPSEPRPLDIEIKVVPTVDHFFAYETKYRFEGSGRMVAVDAPKSFVRPPRTVSISQGSATDSAISLLFFLSRVRDVTNRIVDDLHNSPDRDLYWHIPVDWRYEKKTVHIISSASSGGPINGGRLKFEQKEIEPKADAFVLEIKESGSGVFAPKLLSVSWPDSVKRDSASTNTPVWVYWRPRIGQGGANRFRGNYPFSWDYSYFSLVRNQFYEDDDGFRPSDPLSCNGTKGLAYQLEASGKSAVLVLPSPHTRKQFGHFMNSEFAETYLAEAIAFGFRSVGVYQRPGIGHLAMSSFSAGCNYLEKFISSRINRNSNLIQNLLKEVYFCDPAISRVNGMVKTTMDWAEQPEKIVRFFTQKKFENYPKLVGGNLLPGTLTYTSNASDTRSVMTSASINDWKPTVESLYSTNASYINNWWAEAHHLICGTLHTIALRRSGFSDV